MFVWIGDGGVTQSQDATGQYGHHHASPFVLTTARNGADCCLFLFSSCITFIYSVLLDRVAMSY